MENAIFFSKDKKFFVLFAASSQIPPQSLTGGGDTLGARGQGADDAVGPGVRLDKVGSDLLPGQPLGQVQMDEGQLARLLGPGHQAGDGANAAEEKKQDVTVGGEGLFQLRPVFHCRNDRI